MTEKWKIVFKGGVEVTVEVKVGKYRDLFEAIKDSSIFQIGETIIIKENVLYMRKI